MLVSGLTDHHAEGPRMWHTEMLAAVVMESFPVSAPNSALTNKQTSRKRETGEEPNSCIYTVPFGVEFLNDKGNVWRKVSEAGILSK